MSLNRSSLSRSPAIVTWNGATFFTRDDITVRHLAEYLDVMTSMYGRIDRAKKDLVIKIPLNLWSAWENLSLLFPTSALNPANGSSLYGTTDVPLVIQAKNNDRITYANVQLTKLADLHLGVDGELFSASLEFTALLANNANPEDSGSYFTIDTNAYTDSAFAKTNFKKARATAAWGSVAGFTAIVPQKGFNVAWEYQLKPVVVDGLGTVDMTVDHFSAAVKCIPIQPTLAQLKTNSKIETAHGTLLSANSADFTITASGQSVVLKNAAMKEHGLVFGREPLRIGEVAWETTRAFASGVPAALATVG